VRLDLPKPGLPHGLSPRIPGKPREDRAPLGVEIDRSARSLAISLASSPLESRAGRRG
jgi:hypothetical protein